MKDNVAVETFWQDRLSQLQVASIPVTQCILPLHANNLSTTWSIEWRLPGDETVYAVLSLPVVPGPHPALLLLPPYGSAAHVASYEVRQQYITLTLRHRGMRLTRSSVPATFPGFLTTGIEAVEDYGFTRVVEDCVLGAHFLAGIVDRGSRPLICRGHELALLVAALVPAVTHLVCRVGMWLRMAETVPKTTAYPLEEINDYLRLHPHKASRVWNTLRYFEPLAMAHRVLADTLLIANRNGNLHTPTMTRELFTALGKPQGVHELYWSCHSSSQDERYILEWMARTCQTGDPVLPAQWT